ncbi:hypothetical protein HPB52_004109 [Rhipicephalus sanguineus]|uniref:Uncharacterized protein n=1 Tax=Rhipicephalus sanguineus TaxID=34632 RepID=A0A9D4SQA8_RHISA|nr:hypothetical protein HPB52_004109 [Rhipicephalus sanguineus]
MNQQKEPKRRKLHLVDADKPFVVPRSTVWYNQQRTSMPSTSTAQPSTDFLPDDAAGTTDTAELDADAQQEVSAEASSAGSDDNGLPHHFDAPDAASEAGDSIGDLFADEQSLYLDSDSESACSSEDSDCADEEESASASEPVPHFDDTELLARCIRDFAVHQRASTAPSKCQHLPRWLVVWGKHPDMAVFMGKFVKAFQLIGEIVWQHGVMDLVSNVYLACVCVDAPARAAVGNQTQFNGLFGCPWCLACGTLEDGRRLYINPDIPAPERTTAGVRRDMKLAVELQNPVNGLKGPSAFWSLQYLDLVECFTVEYMHCVLLGVTRQFTDYWFDSSRCHENFYIVM